MKIITQASDTVTRRLTTSRSGKTELAENSFFSAFFGEHFHAFTQSTTTTSTRQQASRCVISKKWWRYMATMTMCYHFPHRARVLIIISKRRFSNQSTAAATAAVSYITHKLSLGLSELVVGRGNQYLYCAAMFIGPWWVCCRNYVRIVISQSNKALENAE